MLAIKLETLSNSMFKAYYQLTKPGIIYGNALTALAGFFLASKGRVDWALFLSMLVGISLVIGSACVCNNYIDRDIDTKMERTKKRALVTNAIPAFSALLFGIILGLLGFIVLVLHTNTLTALLAFIGFFTYIALYTPIKRYSVHGTLVGAIAGAVPIVVGYCSVTNTFNLGAWLLFIIICAWQMPHFYAIALSRFVDYTAANVAVLPVKKGVPITKIQILFYVIIFTIVTTLLTLFHYASYTYLVIMTLLNLAWLVFSIQGFAKNNNYTLWGRKMFLFSLIIITTFSITLSINSFLK